MKREPSFERICLKMSCPEQMPANLQEKSLKLVQRIVHNSETIKGFN